MTTIRAGGVKGPASATDGGLTVFDGTGGKTIKEHASGAPGTAAFKNTGTSGDAVPLLNGANTWSAAQTVTGGVVAVQRSANTPTVSVRRTDTWAGSRIAGLVDFDGTDDAGAEVDGVGRMIVRQTAGAAGASTGTYEFQTTQAGTLATRGIFGAGFYHASATGTDKGVNTINFGAVYDDNTLLTCYPFDAYLDGTVSVEKWDAKAPDIQHPAVLDDDGKEIQPARSEPRQHEGARKFAARLGTEYDPLDIDKYTAHWKEKRHLSSLPNEDKFDIMLGLPTGAWIQRLIETVEIQAIHIAKLNDRLKVLEASPSRRP